MAEVKRIRTPVRQRQALHLGKKRLRLCFDGLSQQAACAAAQDSRQWIVDRVGLTERNNSAIVHRGVSLLREVQAGFHPPRYAAFLKSSSPRFGDSSRG
jgi:hypothetical protein